MASYEKFKSRFGDKVILYNSFDELKSLSHLDAAYFIKAGFSDGLVIPGIKNIIHAVFNASAPHGDVYVAVSEWLGKKYNVDYLPHIVSLPEIEENYREELGIKKDEIVFGRYGGYDQFDVQYLPEVIKAVADKGIKFLLMNTKPFPFDHPNIIYLSPETDPHVKSAFINTCDAMIHGRNEGESFGLAIAEFLHNNKPVVTNIEARDRNHLYILKDKGLYYSSNQELYAILSSFKKKDYNVSGLIKSYNPISVMDKFKNLLFNK
jgi:hypothetical protein